MALAAYVLKGVFSRAIFYAQKYFKKGTEVYPPYTNAGAPTSGGSGTLLGTAEKGALLIDTTNGTLYQCSASSSSSITWTQFTTASGSGAFTGTYNGTVGATTPADGKFTTLSTSGLATLASATVTGTLSVGGLELNSVANALSSSATKTRAGGTALTKQFNRVTTVATSGDAVTLPALAAGQWCIVFNDHASKNIIVFANGASDQIDGQTADTGYVTLSATKRAIFICFATNVIISAQLGVASA